MRDFTYFPSSFVFFKNVEMSPGIFLVKLIEADPPFWLIKLTVFFKQRFKSINGLALFHSFYLFVEKKLLNFSLFQGEDVKIIRSVACISNLVMNVLFSTCKSEISFMSPFARF